MLFGWSGKLNVSRLENLKAPTTLGGIAWATLLVWFMRVMSVLWLMKGLAGWATILGATGEADAFVKASLMQQVGIVLFAVLDLVAGVGLWMAAGWGGGVWLIAVASHVVIALAFPRAIAIGNATFITYGALALTFMVLAWASLHHDEG